jgi:glutathionylspermidine synthase
VSDYERLAAEVVLGGIVTDPWLDGVPRLAESPVFVDEALAARLARAAEDLAYAYHQACLLVSARPALLDDFYGLTPAQKAMWLASAPRWHGIARADVFVTNDGLAVTELNSDTPTGEAEAVVLGELFAKMHPEARDPNARLGDRFVAMVEAMAEGPLAAGVPRTAAIVYPTELTEDLALVRQYKRWLERAGWTVVLGSPFNLGAGDEGEACLWGEPCAVVVRHYKTDWWSERVAAWDDVDLPDRVALARELSILLEAELAGKTAVVNPLGAVVPQNKRTMALFWEHLADLPERAQSIVRALVPPTFRLESRSLDELVVDRADWVLKSDYGAEGDEVIVGAAVTDALWRESLAHARPGHWVVQRLFEPEVDGEGRQINHGVFVVAGQAAGHYVRMQRGPTDERAVSAAVLIRLGSVEPRGHRRRGRRPPPARTRAVRIRATRCPAAAPRRSRGPRRSRAPRMLAPARARRRLGPSSRGARGRRTSRACAPAPAARGDT